MHVGTQQDLAPGDDAVRLPLPGGWVATARGAGLHRVTRAPAELGRPARIPA